MARGFCKGRTVHPEFRDETFAFPVKKFDGLSEEELAESFVTGLLLGVYQFNEFKTLERDKIKEIEEAILLGEKDEDIKCDRGRA